MEQEKLECGCVGCTQDCPVNKWCTSRGEPVFQVKNICNEHQKKYDIPVERNSSFASYTLYFFQCGCAIVIKYVDKSSGSGFDSEYSESLFKSIMCNNHTQLENECEKINTQIFNIKKDLEEKYKKKLQELTEPLHQQRINLKLYNPNPFGVKDPDYKIPDPPKKRFKSNF